MRWRLIAVIGGLLGAVLGAATALALRSPQTPEPVVSPPPVVVATTEEHGPSHSPQRLLLVWSAGGLPEELDRGVGQLTGVRRVSVVRAGRVDLLRSAAAAGHSVDEYPRGWVVPLDGFAIDRRSYRRMVPAPSRAAFTALRRGRVLLGETSARLRRLDVGDHLVLAGGQDFTVAGIVDDSLIGAAEVVFAGSDARRVGIDSARFMLVEYAGSRHRVEAAIRRSAPEGTVLRIRGPGEAPYLRHGDAVLPQALLKETFGEFAYRPGSGREFDQDPRWRDANIVSAHVPILGAVRCHRLIIDSLRGALAEIETAGLEHLVDPDEYQGCWNPRLITEGGALSRHAWGIAFDINAATNPTGLGSGQDRRLVDVMQRWGFTWGGFWLIPDPMHFEYLGPPEP